jgi:hypothetical protein
MWKYAAMADPMSSEAHFRELGYTITSREVAAVSDWLDNSVNLFHVMRDHVKQVAKVLCK